MRGHVGTMNASIVRAVTRRLDIGAEVVSAVSGNNSLQRAQLQVLVGGNYGVDEGLTLDVGVIAGHFVASPRVGLR